MVDKYEYIVIMKLIFILQYFAHFYECNVEISICNTKKYAVMNYIK
jgi:hypothetical protein